MARIALKLSFNPFLTALGYAEEARWFGGTCKGKTEAEWLEIAKQEQAKAEARGEAY